MIIPVRCITCGKEVGSLWKKYNEEIGKGRDPKEVLDEMGLNKYCCRALFLTHKDTLKRVAKFKV